MKRSLRLQRSRLRRRDATSPSAKRALWLENLEPRLLLTNFFRQDAEGTLASDSLNGAGALLGAPGRLVMRSSY